MVTRAEAAPPGRSELLLPSLMIGRVIAHVRARGGDADADALIARFGLAPSVERDPVAILPISRFYQLLDEAALALNDPFLGVHVGEHGAGEGANVLEFVCRGATDLRGALERYVRFAGTVNEALLVTAEPEGTGIRLCLRIPGYAFALGRHGNEHWLATLLVIARRASGAVCIPERVHLSHPRPADTTEIERALGTSKLTFDADHNGLSLGARLLATPLLPAQAPLSTLLDRYAALAPSGLPRVSQFHGRVLEAIRTRLSKGEPTLPVIARALSIGARTLQRRLADDAFTFEGVVDEVRADLARLYVSRGELSVDEMAARLGYAQRSNFLRAFKRWTGTTPKKMRAG
ncbi:MAG: AraC family transcriptional regulator ligand-binding domain-containing protein [Minicystis sp.]